MNERKIINTTVISGDPKTVKFTMENWPSEITEQIAKILKATITTDDSGSHFTYTTTDDNDSIVEFLHCIFSLSQSTYISMKHNK